MKATVWVGAVVVMGGCAMSCAAQAAANGAAERVGASESLTGKWQMTANFYGTPTYGGLQLE